MYVTTSPNLVFVCMKCDYCGELKKTHPTSSSTWLSHVFSVYLQNKNYIVYRWGQGRSCRLIHCQSSTTWLDQLFSAYIYIYIICVYWSADKQVSYYSIFCVCSCYNNNTLNMYDTILHFPGVLYTSKWMQYMWACGARWYDTIIVHFVLPYLHHPT